MKVHTEQSLAAERMSYGISMRGDGEQQLSACTTAAVAAVAAARSRRRRKRRRRESSRIKYAFLMASTDSLQQQLQTSPFLNVCTMTGSSSSKLAFPPGHLALT